MSSIRYRIFLVLLICQVHFGKIMMYNDNVEEKT